MFFACRCIKVYDVLCSEWFVGKHHIGHILPEIFEDNCFESIFTRTVSTEKSDFLGFLYHKKMINMTFDEFDELRSCRTFKAVSDTLIQA